MDELQVYELYDIWYKPWWHSTPAKVFFVILLVSVAIVCFWLLAKYMRKRVVVPYWQQLLAQCVQLRKQSDALDLPILYAHLTALFKEYLEKRYSLQVKQLTDQELVDEIKKLSLSESQQESVRELLMYAVPAKFDAEQCNVADPLIHISYLETFIKETQPTTPS